MFRECVLNVFVHNRDDPLKNFTHLYNETEDRWHLSPAYDLTYSNTYLENIRPQLDGNGRNPGKKNFDGGNDS